MKVQKKIKKWEPSLNKLVEINLHKSNPLLYRFFSADGVELAAALSSIGLFPFTAE